MSRTSGNGNFSQTLVSNAEEQYDRYLNWYCDSIIFQDIIDLAVKTYSDMRGAGETPVIAYDESYYAVKNLVETSLTIPSHKTDVDHEAVIVEICEVVVWKAGLDYAAGVRN